MSEEEFWDRVLNSLASNPVRKELLRRWVSNLEEGSTPRFTWHNIAPMGEGLTMVKDKTEVKEWNNFLEMLKQLAEE